MDLMQFKMKQMRDFLKLNYGMGKEFFSMDDSDNDSTTMVAIDDPDQNDDADPSMDITLNNFEEFEEGSRNNSLLSSYYAAS